MSDDVRKFDGPQISDEDKERWPTVVEALQGRTIASVSDNGNTILNFTDGSAVMLLGGHGGEIFFVVDAAEAR